MLVFSEIFGSSPVSKLFMNVRERLGLCYYCNASYEIYKGVLFVTSGVDPASREEAETEIFRQLDEIRDGHITSAEFDAAIHSLINSYRAISDFPATLESYYDGRDVFALSCTIEECMAGIMRVTPEDVIRVAKGIRADTVYFLWGDKEQNEEDEDDINDAV